MSVFDLPKIDGHCHLLDPLGFPYAADVAYRPAGQETGNQAYFEQLMDGYGVRHALLVGPNSGYNFDNRCLLRALDTGRDRFKGIAVLPMDTSEDTLVQLQERGVVGVAFNVALQGLAYYAELPSLLRKLHRLGLWAQFQVQGNQLCQMPNWLDLCGDLILIDHCGRPDMQGGLQQAGFQALLALGRSGRAVVKLSGEYKFSGRPFPFEDTQPYVDALLEAFGPQRCIWASDWPYLKAPSRIDYGPMLRRWERIAEPQVLHQIMWTNPARLFGFAAHP